MPKLDLIPNSLTIVSFSLVHLLLPGFLSVQAQEKFITSVKAEDVLINTSLCSMLPLGENIFTSLSSSQKKSSNNTISRTDTSSPRSMAQSTNGLTYLGTVNGDNILNDPITGLIVLVVGGATLIYSTISDAISAIGNSASSSQKKRCEYAGEFKSPDPKVTVKSCAYNCRGYGALATFEWPLNKACPPSFDGNFPGP